MQLTIQQAADYLGVSRQRAEQLISKWDFAVHRTKIGNRNLKTIDREQIDAYLAERTNDRVMPKPPPGHVTSGEAATILGVSPKAVRGYCQKGLLSHVKTENRLFVNEQALESFVPPKRGRPKSHPHHYDTENHYA